MKRSIITALAISILVASVAACTARDTASYSCLDAGRPVYDVPTNQTSSWPAVALLLANNTAIDARGNTFIDDTLDANGFSHGMKFHEQTGSRDNLCLVGGVIETHFDPENTSWATWHRIVGLIVEVDNFTVIGTTIRNEGDGIAFVNADNWKVIGVRVDGGANLAGGYMHDDCVENDNMADGLVDDSKFDGCSVFMSSSSGRDGTGREVTVSNSLVRLQPYRNNYNTLKYGENTHGGFFKWSNPLLEGSGTPPHLVVKNSVFRADKRGSFGGNSGGFNGLPPGTECDNVMLIGSETWGTKDLNSWKSQCTNLTFGTMTDWNARIADWDAKHPAIG